MKIILLKDIPKVGRKYDIKNVSDGYAVNMLIPKCLAILATNDSIKRVESIKANDLTHKKIQEELLTQNLEKLNKLKLSISERASEKGHLFAGITKERVIEEILKDTRLNLSSDFIQMEKPIKELGLHKIKIIAQGKEAEIILEILPKI